MLEEIELGGCRQWILIRGRDIDNPFLLFLHGGPGMSAMYLAHALELLTYLKNRFEVPKVYLAAHSWGTRLGMHLVRKAPQNFYAYVGMGQLAFRSEIPAIQDRFIRREANKAGNRKALRELTLKGRSVHEKWVFRFGGELYATTNFWPLLWTDLRAPEYTLSDALNITKGVSLYNRHFRSREFPDDLAEEVLFVRVPVYFFTSRHDYCVPFELSERHFKKLHAPLKRIVWFEHSAHFPFFEEPLKFAEEMHKILDETSRD